MEGLKNSTPIPALSEDLCRLLSGGPGAVALGIIISACAMAKAGYQSAGFGIYCQMRYLKGSIIVSAWVYYGEQVDGLAMKIAAF